LYLRTLSKTSSRERLSCSDDACDYREALKHILVDTIEALEETRRAFKSKQIEMLRKKLTQILLEMS